MDTQGVWLVGGTRPEAIKLAPLALALDRQRLVRPVLVATGQHPSLFHKGLATFGLHPDRELSPHRDMGTQAELVGQLADQLDREFLLDPPSAVVVQGDTSSALVGALTAFWRQIPVVHLEAGLRSHDLSAPFPEEANRRMVGQISALHLAPTPAAAANLLAEGIKPDVIEVIGNTVVDAVLTLAGRTSVFAEPALQAVEDALSCGRRLVLVTVHRRESWGEPMRSVLHAVRDILETHPDTFVVLPAHPNPSVRADVVSVLGTERRVVITEPVDYPDLVRLLELSTLVLSDSGGIQEEAPSFGVPVMVLRDRTERLEAIEAGCAFLVGTRRDRIVATANRLLTEHAPRSDGLGAGNPFGDGRAADRAAVALARLVGLTVEPIAQFVPPQTFLGAEPIPKTDPKVSEPIRESGPPRDCRRPPISGRERRTELGHTSVTEQGPPIGVWNRIRWQRRYAANLSVSDTFVVFGALMLAHVSGVDRTSPSQGYVDLHKLAWLSLIASVWLLALARFHTRSPRVIGFGIDEYRRVVAASCWAFGAIAIATLLLRLDVAPAYLAVAFPVGILGLVLSRRRWRQYVAGRREAGGYRTSVLAIGDRDAVSNLATELTRHSRDGYRVVAVGIPGYGPPRGEHLVVNGREIPIIGGETHASDAVRACGADTVVIAGTEHFGAHGIRRIIWELEPMDVDLVLSPGVMDVAQSRLAMRPIAGLPLLHVEKPQYRGATRLQKRAFDFGFALVVLTLALPILLLAAVAIRLGSKGPVFYSSERIGVDGTPFSMLKLRTMVNDADEQLEKLRSRNECDGPLFKMRDDPRVTAVGRILRRLSIDELPQFINVLRHEMSVVGPRPPLRREVDTYDCDVQRRLLVKPGITGLWQVNGRSDLSWEEAVRLDLWYVDNWSIVGDLLIIAKTVRAVLQRSGAY